MRFRFICEYVEDGEKRPVSKWLDKNMTVKVRAKLHARFNQIEGNETENGSWLKPYVSLKMWEIVFNQDGVAYRFLCERIKTNVIMVLATSKNGQITKEEEARAVARRAAIKEFGDACVRVYPLPERPSEDLDPVYR